MTNVSNAPLYLKFGMERDQWSNEIIDGSRNNSVLIVDCSEGAWSRRSDSFGLGRKRTDTFFSGLSGIQVRQRGFICISSEKPENRHRKIFRLSVI
jgi:hypothetical protein